MSSNLLSVEGLTKEFNGFCAVDNVNLKVEKGSIHALIGPNGAGKSTLFNLLTKFLDPSSGKIIFNGQDITREQPSQIAKRGIIRSFQISAVFPNMTVLENVRIALQRKLGTSYHLWKSVSTLNTLNKEAMDILDSVGLAEFSDTITVNLSYGRKRALEIATTLAVNPVLMLLDEPTQGMGHEDIDRVKELIKRVSAGRTILMVEHNMSLVASLADTITVLQRGSILAEGSYSEVAKDPQVIEAYMGNAHVEVLGEH
ncbi:ABC transporter ATP-binding protein [Marinobacterium lutimaris]|uniref:Amino acid/amide ABC transporter ATP-binding protein 1, HAAT family n=1 Tax=Marinobacterium lutimaris TaxID=568106 RepID=A0A1H6DUD1_9GAMM|nr:ABC transporter ATP-binding protein [Marinobacterium lutimaris]SEG88888.1 amino acid/amide ABC transporter ATP-binding protein 1, HAAT family [Marinobacterium lutimaris]